MGKNFDNFIIDKIDTIDVISKLIFTKTSKRTQTQRNEKPIYNRTSDLLKENSTVSKNKRVENGQKEEVDNRTKQETLNKEIIVNSKEEISIEKTNEILNEINKYLDEEKKKLN